VWEAVDGRFRVLLRMRSEAKCHRDGICHERDQSFGFVGRKLESESAIQKEVDSIFPDEAGLKEGHLPTVHHYVV
jgi:hypothetical protein